MKHFGTNFFFTGSGSKGQKTIKRIEDLRETRAEDLRKM